MEVTTTHRDIPAGYDVYLARLQERNRQRRLEREKDTEARALEQRERGFNVFLNGSNCRAPKPRSTLVSAATADRSFTRDPRSAAPAPSRVPRSQSSSGPNAKVAVTAATHAASSSRGWHSNADRALTPASPLSQLAGKPNDIGVVDDNIDEEFPPPSSSPQYSSVTSTASSKSCTSDKSVRDDTLFQSVSAYNDDGNDGDGDNVQQQQQQQHQQQEVVVDTAAPTAIPEERARTATLRKRTLSGNGDAVYSKTAHSRAAANPFRKPRSTTNQQQQQQQQQQPEREDTPRTPIRTPTPQTEPAHIATTTSQAGPQWLQRALTKSSTATDPISTATQHLVLFPPPHIRRIPMGDTLSINILSTHGDPHYVGLSGIEIHCALTGALIHPSRVSATPFDLNVLPGVSGDPRVPTNLFNGHNRSTDDSNMWLIPFTRGSSHLLTIQLPQRIRIAQLRLFNYNRNVRDTRRGAKTVRMELNGRKLFEGDIARARGHDNEIGDVLLFTRERSVLERVEKNDPLFVWPDQVSDSRIRREEEKEERGKRTSTKCEEESVTSRAHRELIAPHEQSTVVTEKEQLIKMTFYASPKATVIAVSRIVCEGSDGQAIALGVRDVRVKGAGKAVYGSAYGLVTGKGLCYGANWPLVVHVRVRKEELRQEEEEDDVLMMVKRVRIECGLHERFGADCGADRVEIVVRHREKVIGRVEEKLSSGEGEMRLTNIQSGHEMKLAHSAISDHEKSTGRVCASRYEPVLMPVGRVLELRVGNDSDFIGLEKIEIERENGVRMNGRVVRRRAVEGAEEMNETEWKWKRIDLRKPVRIRFEFDEPITLCVISLWNHQTCPVKEIQVRVDGFVVFEGTLRGRVKGKQDISFAGVTSRRTVGRPEGQEREEADGERVEEQPVRFVNDGKVYNCQ